MITGLTLTETVTLAPDRQLSGARWLPQGDAFAAGGLDGTVRLWRQMGNAWVEQPRLEGHHGWVEGLACPLDGRQLFTADSWGEIRCWDLTADPIRLEWSCSTAHDGWIRQLAVSPDGTQLASCGRDGRLRLWKTDTGELLHEFPSQPADLFCVAFHPDGKSLVTGDLRGHVQQWESGARDRSRAFDASELSAEDRLQEVGGARRLVFDSAGQRLAVAGTRPKNGGNVQGVPVVLLFDWKTGQRTHALELGGTSDVYACDVAFHPAGFIAAVTSGNPGTGQIVCLRPGAEEPLVREKKLANCHALSLHADGTRLLVTSTNKGSNGNGRKLEKDGSYSGNHSPVTLFSLTMESAAG